MTRLYSYDVIFIPGHKFHVTYSNIASRLSKGIKSVRY